MYTKDAIRYSLNLADQAVMRSLETIEDAPLTFPTENGGCHPLWVVGHLAFVEGLTHEMLGAAAIQSPTGPRFSGRTRFPPRMTADIPGCFNSLTPAPADEGHHALADAQGYPRASAVGILRLPASVRIHGGWCSRPGSPDDPDAPFQAGWHDTQTRFRTMEAVMPCCLGIAAAPGCAP